MKPYQCNGTLLTDLYVRTMLQACHAQCMNEIAVFEFFVRHMLELRSFLVGAVLGKVISYLTPLRCEDDDLAWLPRQGRFSESFIAALRDLRFTGRWQVRLSWI
ncbi:hypothetical protein GCM10027343_40610 [Noviherbaspirillum agri]